MPPERRALIGSRIVHRNSLRSLLVSVFFLGGGPNKCCRRFSRFGTMGTTRDGFRQDQRTRRGSNVFQDPTSSHLLPPFLSFLPGQNMTSKWDFHRASPFPYLPPALNIAVCKKSVMCVQGSRRIDKPKFLIAR